MAALKRLLSQSDRRFFANPPPPRHLISLLRRHFSDEAQSPPIAETSREPNSNSREPLPIQPVSYPAKPKPPPSEEIQPESAPEEESPRIYSQDSENTKIHTWTRDEMRYMKDAPTISPVSYPSRVAPLPEDRMEMKEVEDDNNVEMERERRRIEQDRWRGGLRYVKEEEVENLPFPKLIKIESSDQSNKKKTKAIYDLKEAIRLVKANARETFDETFEAHVKMTPELRRTDLKLKDEVRLPHGFGKTYRVAVFAEGAAADDARNAGADIVGGPELVENIRSGNLKVDFDKCISTPSMMEHVKKLSKNLRKLMPDTKKGTLTNDIYRAVKEAKEQSVPFEKDKTAIVHVGLGKLTFAEEALQENVGAFVNALLRAKPANLKKSSKYAGYVDTFHICSTMGPSFCVSMQSLSMAADRQSRLQSQ